MDLIWIALTALVPATAAVLVLRPQPQKVPVRARR